MLVALVRGHTLSSMALEYANLFALKYTFYMKTFYEKFLNNFKYTWS